MDSPFDLTHGIDAFHVAQCKPVTAAIDGTYGQTDTWMTGVASRDSKVLKRKAYTCQNVGLFVIYC